MATVSMNGWLLIADTTGPLETISAGGLSTKVRSGDVGTVLEYVGRAFDAEVENLTTFFGWRSVAYNAEIGGHPQSNHPSGTAVDCNGGKHPRYRHGTFTPAQVAAIRRIIAAASPVVRWGGDWNNDGRLIEADVDEMHFEIVGTPAQVAIVAARVRPWLNPTPVTVPPVPTTPTPAPEEDDMNGDRAYTCTSGDGQNWFIFGNTKRPISVAQRDALSVLGPVAKIEYQGYMPDVALAAFADLGGVQRIVVSVEGAS